MQGSGGRAGRGAVARHPGGRFPGATAAASRCRFRTLVLLSGRCACQVGGRDHLCPGGLRSHHPRYSGPSPRREPGMTEAEVARLIAVASLAAGGNPLGDHHLWRGGITTWPPSRRPSGSWSTAISSGWTAAARVGGYWSDFGRAGVVVGPTPGAAGRPGSHP